MISRLFSPCLLGHSTAWHRGPNGSKLCDRCLQPVGTILSGEMIATPLPQHVAGEPNVKARRVVRANVSTWKRSSR